MVDNKEGRLDRTFGALADATRRTILEMLSRRSYTVGELARPFPVSLNAISKHLKVLERAGLLRRRIDGSRHYCSLDARPLEDAFLWLESYEPIWEEGLDGVADDLQQRPRRQNR